MTDVEKKKPDEKSGQLVGGFIVLGIGCLFLLVNMDILPPIRDTWPVILIVVGLALIIGTFFKKKKPSETE